MATKQIHVCDSCGEESCLQYPPWAFVEKYPMFTESPVKHYCFCQKCWDAMLRKVQVND